MKTTEHPNKSFQDYTDDELLDIVEWGLKGVIHKPRGIAESIEDKKKSKKLPKPKK